MYRPRARANPTEKAAVCPKFRRNRMMRSRGSSACKRARIAKLSSVLPSSTMMISNGTPPARQRLCDLTVQFFERPRLITDRNDDTEIHDEHDALGSRSLPKPDPTGSRRPRLPHSIRLSAHLGRGFASSTDPIRPKPGRSPNAEPLASGSSGLSSLNQLPVAGARCPDRKARSASLLGISER